MAPPFLLVREVHHPGAERRADENAIGVPRHHVHVRRLLRLQLLQLRGRGRVCGGCWRGPGSSPGGPAKPGALCRLQSADVQWMLRPGWPLRGRDDGHRLRNGRVDLRRLRAQWANLQRRHLRIRRPRALDQLDPCSEPRAVVAGVQEGVSGLSDRVSKSVHDGHERLRYLHLHSRRNVRTDDPVHSSASLVEHMERPQPVPTPCATVT